MRPPGSVPAELDAPPPPGERGDAPNRAAGPGAARAAAPPVAVPSVAAPSVAAPSVAAPPVAADVAVVGAGIAGLSLAYALTAAGLTVVVLEGGRLGAQGASSLPAALLNPHRGRSGRADPDDLRGLEAFWRRDRALRAAGLEPGSHRVGALRIADGAARAERWRALAAAHPGVRWLEPGAVPAPYHAPHGGFVVEAGGWIEPALLLAALATALRRSGGEIREAVRVDAAQGGVDGVTLGTAAGPLRVRAAALCVGAERAPGLPLPPLARIAGEVIELASTTPFRWPLAGGVYGAWHAARGSAYVGGGHREPEAPEPDAAAALQRRFALQLPHLADAQRTSLWRGVRAKRPGHRPWVTELEPNLWLFGAFAGRGFLCSANEAERLAADLRARLHPGEAGNA